jgi:uncharacterized protein (DUF1800 family)
MYKETDIHISNEYAYIATNRFANGANNKHLRSIAKATNLADAQSWLIEQLTPYKLPDTNWTSEQAILGNYNYKAEQDQAEQTMAMQNSMSGDNSMLAQTKATRKSMIEATRGLAEQTALAAITTKQPFQAKLLDFFSNHFSVSRANLVMTLLAPTLEVEAIAPNLTTSFAHMLTAVTTHPAMLLYLNNERSMGPNSRAGKNRKARNKAASGGLNENLAREIMELHTLGVNSGYSQQDVTELARAITGWSIGSPRRNERPVFLFRTNMHEPGKRII